MSHLTQMAGLTVQNFVSAAVGIAVAIAVIRGLVRRESPTIGNFWVDLTRSVTRVLLPLAHHLRPRLCRARHGAEPARRRPRRPRSAAPSRQIYRGPVASQEAIKELGTNGGGPMNANSAHPYENPSGLTNLLEMWALLMIPFALTFTFGRLAKDTARAGCFSPRCSSSGSARREPRRRSSCTETRRYMQPAETWKAKRCASAQQHLACSRRARPALRPARSSPPTTASHRSAAPFRSST